MKFTGDKVEEPGSYQAVFHIADQDKSLTPTGELPIESFEEGDTFPSCPECKEEAVWIFLPTPQEPQDNTTNIVDINPAHIFP